MRYRFRKLLGLSQSMYIDKMLKSLAYMLCTNPNVSFAVSVTSKFQSMYGQEHWAAVKNILQYLRTTKELFLVNGEGDLQVSGHLDASFQSDKDDCKSQSGFVCFIMSG